ncbi:hypothetical protein AGMMS50267_17780 [Spirochaetia bacterium]|nr:hypothetical protein AGMMS50267_17780 [Spirochaetia bacterium]
MLFVSIAGAVMNMLVCHFLRNRLGIPLFLDTVLTMTVTFYGGVFWGALTGALTNLMQESLPFVGWGAYLFIICNIAVALVTALFIRWFPQELRIAGTEKTLPKNKSRWFQDLMGKAIVLVLLSFALCLVISVLGGLCAVIIDGFTPPTLDTALMSDFKSPEQNFRIALIQRNFPGLIVEIGSRIPVNLLDRLISSFAGYALAVLLAFGERKLR